MVSLPTLPLFELFQELRVPLSLQPEQYVWLLEGLKQGFGCESIDDLKEVCRLLWLKSRDSQAEEAFETTFNRYIEKHQQTPQSVTKSSLARKETASYPTSLQNQYPTYQPATNQTTSSQSTSSNLRLTSAYQTTQEMEVTQSQQGYILKVSDFPFLLRQTRHAWLRLRYPQKRGETSQIDIPATIKKIGRYGICLEPETKPQLINQIELVFLEDREGSMIPFRPMIDGLFTTVEKNRFQGVYRYFFRNCPGDFVYLRPKGADTILLEDLPLKTQRTILVIISDAGAARGGHSFRRIEMTEKFLSAVQPRIKSLLWINPLPYKRWTGTTAADIAGLMGVKMFELSAISECLS